MSLIRKKLVHFGMRTGRVDFEIARIVVLAVAILVMNEFGAFQLSFQNFFHDESVLVPVCPIHFDESVTRRVDDERLEPGEVRIATSFEPSPVKPAVAASVVLPITILELASSHTRHCTGLALPLQGWR